MNASRLAVIINAPLTPCGYPGCARTVYAPRPACLEHWMALPDGVRECLWREYRALRLGGDEAGSGQQHRALAVRQLAQAHWVILEGLSDGLTKSRQYLEFAKHHRRRALALEARDPFEGLELGDVLEDDDALEDITV